MKNNESENQPGEAILESHISTYLDKTGFVLFWVLLAITMTEIIVCVLIKMDHFNYFLNYSNNIHISSYDFIKNATINTLLIWIFYIVYLIAFQVCNFKKKKILISITVMMITSILCFGHWKYSYLSILYSVPVVFTAPLGNRSHKIVFVISLIISVIYSVFQYIYFKTDYNMLICVVSIISLIAFYLISKYFYVAMQKSLMDLEKYFTLINQLHDEISHDFVTGAFSKQKLNQDFESNKNFKSIAFIDIDNFKYINDNAGHNIGDNILKIFTKNFITENINIYRYGGDEFVVLSEYSTSELAEKIELIKNSFNEISKKLFSCNATFSAGIINVNRKLPLETLLKECDTVMYNSKKQGKNRISIKNKL